MFDLFSWSHILILLAVALVVVGPKDLPKLMHMVGKWVGKARGLASDFKKSFDDMARQSELDELRKEIEGLKATTQVATESHIDLGPLDSGAPDAGPEPRAGEFKITETAPPAMAATEQPPAMIAPTPEDEAALNATRAPLMEHLLELRKRLVWALASFAVCFVACFSVATPIFNFLIKPLHATTNHLIYTALTEVFFTQVKIGMFGGACLAFPIIAWQLWIFIAPGLYRHEKRAFLPFLLWTPVMFAIGAGFVYFVMLPFAIRFFGGYQVPTTAGAMGIELQAKVGDYLDFVMTLMFAFGLTFQLPVLLSLLGKVGLVTVKNLKDMRRFAYVGLFAVAAIFTPPDAISMMSLAIPLVALYEISVFCVMLIERQRLKEAAMRAAAARDVVLPQ